MLRRVLVPLLVVASLAGAAAEAEASPTRVVRCHSAVDYNILISSARNMTCRAAAKEMRRYRKSIARRFRTPGGFRCYRVSGGALGGQWRCVRGARAFRFEFGD
jgi:hypothetical protein